ncbi:glycosyltransferase family 2 protein [Lysobacter xanthus]
MNRWPPEGLEEFAAALPFGHLLRGRPPMEAVARWRSESDAFTRIAAPRRVALLVEPTGDDAALAATLASWRLQTWPDTPWILCDEAPCCGDSQPLPLFTRPAPDAVELRAAQIDWVIPAVAGDVLHPSLAGIVALADGDADLVGWDWLDAQRDAAGGLRPVRLRRAPARDGVAERHHDRRGRAFAIRAASWKGRPRADAWHCRMAPVALREHVHAEPLSLHAVMQPVPPVDAAVLAAYWMHPFDVASDGALHPVHDDTSVSVVVMFRDQSELTIAAIRSLVRQRLVGTLELILVDNGSSDASRDAVEQAVRSECTGAVRFVHYPGPFNHSAQANAAARAATGEVLVFLNNDAELIDDDALDRLARWALLPCVATVGLQLLDADGACIGGAFHARARPGHETDSPVEEVRGESGALSREVVGNTFACVAIRREVFQTLGGLDEVAFPAGYNDVDLCLRARALGWRHVYLGDVRAQHRVGASRARQDEVAQKLLLRRRHPGLQVDALRQYDAVPVALPPLAAVAPAPFSEATTVP